MGILPESCPALWILYFNSIYHKPFREKVKIIRLQYSIYRHHLVPIVSDSISLLSSHIGSGSFLNILTSPPSASYLSVHSLTPVGLYWNVTLPMRPLLYTSKVISHPHTPSTIFLITFTFLKHDLLFIYFVYCSLIIYFVYCKFFPLDYNFIRHELLLILLTAVSLGPCTKYDRVEDESHISKKLGRERGGEAGPRERWRNEGVACVVLFKAGILGQNCRREKKQPLELSRQQTSLNDQNKWKGERWVVAHVCHPLTWQMQRQKDQEFKVIFNCSLNSRRPLANKTSSQRKQWRRWMGVGNFEVWVQGWLALLYWSPCKEGSTLQCKAYFSEASCWSKSHSLLQGHTPPMT